MVRIHNSHCHCFHLFISSRNNTQNYVKNNFLSCTCEMMSHHFQNVDAWYLQKCKYVMTYHFSPCLHFYFLQNSSVSLVTDPCLTLQVIFCWFLGRENIKKTNNNNKAFWIIPIHCVIKSVPSVVFSLSLHSCLPSYPISTIATPPHYTTITNTNAVPVPTPDHPICCLTVGFHSSGYGIGKESYSVIFDDWVHIM